MATKQPKCRVVTPSGIGAFAYVHKPDTGKEKSDGKHKITLVVDTEEALAELKAKALKHFRVVYPDAPIADDEIKLPFSSGDGMKQEEFHGKWLLRAKSKFPPKAIDTKRKALPKGVQVRSGDLVRLVINLYAYDKVEKVKEGKKIIDVKTWGVSPQLDLVQLIQKNAGGGGVELLDDIDGFDGDDFEDLTAVATGTTGAAADDNGGDF